MKDLVAIVALLACGTRPGAAGDPEPPAIERSSEPRSGVSIERAVPEMSDEVARARLQAWQQLYDERLAELRLAARQLFDELERSSLAALRDRCRRLKSTAAQVDRRGLFGSAGKDLDQVLFGALERFRSGATECVAGRYLNSYRLLVEAQMGLDWIDRRLTRRIRGPIRLPGLDRPE